MVVYCHVGAKHCRYCSLSTRAYTHARRTVVIPRYPTLLPANQGWCPGPLRPQLLFRFLLFFVVTFLLQAAAAIVPSPRPRPGRRGGGGGRRMELSFEDGEAPAEEVYRVTYGAEPGMAGAAAPRPRPPPPGHPSALKARRPALDASPVLRAKRQPRRRRPPASGRQRLVLGSAADGGRVLLWRGVWRPHWRVG